MIDKGKLKELRPAIDAALATVGEAHGVKLRAGNASYDPALGTFSFKLEGQDATGEAPEMLLLRQYASLYDVDLGWLDRDYKARDGKAYRLCGLKSGRGEPKCLARGVDGKTYLFPVKAFWTLARKDAEVTARVGTGPTGSPTLDDLRRKAYEAATK